MSTADKQLLVHVWLKLWQVRMMLWCVSYKATRNWLENRVSTNITVYTDPIFVQKISRFVNNASRFVPHTSCLIRALVAEAFLRKLGYSPFMCIGIKMSGSNFEAHAWLEMSGEKIIGGRVAKEFKQIYCE